MQEIARRAGFTTGAIYGRFRGKAELLLAAIEARTHNELEQLFAEHRFEGRVTDVLTTVGSHLVTDPFDDGQALLLEAFVAARRDPEVAALMRGLLEQRAADLRRPGRGGQGSGLRSTPTSTPTSIVRFCHAVGLRVPRCSAPSTSSHPPATPWEQLIARLVDVARPSRSELTSLGSVARGRERREEQGAATSSAHPRRARSRCGGRSCRATSCTTVSSSASRGIDGRRDRRPRPTSGPALNSVGDVDRLRW